MSIINCLLDKANAGIISKANYKKVSELLDQYKAARRSGSDAVNEYSAAKDILENLEYDAYKRGQQALISAEKIADAVDQVKASIDKGMSVEEAAHALSYKEPWIKFKFGYTGLSVEERVAAKVNLYGGIVARHLEKIKPRKLGLLREKDFSDQIVRDMYAKLEGKDGLRSKDADVRAASDGFEELANIGGRDFESLGGKLKNRSDFFLGLFSDNQAMAQAGKKAWVDTMLRLDTNWGHVKNIIPDLDIMSDKAKADFLSDVWEMEVSGGVIKDGSPLSHGMRNIAGSRSAHRILRFNSADSWIEYSGKFGKGDLFNTVMDYTRKIALDNSILEVYGANPDAFRNSISKELGQYNVEGAKALSQTLESEMNHWTMSSPALTAGTHTVKKNMSRIKAGMRATMLGATAVDAVVGDMMSAGNFARQIRGLPTITTVGKTLNSLFSPMGNLAEKTQLAAEMGYLLDTFMQETSNELTGVMSTKLDHVLHGSAEGVNTAFGLKRVDRANRVSNTTEAVLNLANEALGKGESTPAFKQWLASSGITEKELNIIKNHGIREVDTLYGAGVNIVDATQMFKSIDPEVRLVAEKVSALAADISEAGSPTRNPNTQRWFGEIASRGAGQTVLAGLGSTFTGYFSSMWRNHIRLYMKSGGAPERMARVASFAIATTVLGIASTQIRAIAQGKDPSKINIDLIMQGISRGGLFGPVTDLLVNGGSGGGGFTDRFFPAAGILEQLTRLGPGNISKALKGKDTSFGADLVDTLRMLTPGQNGWYTGLLFRRYLFDQLQKAVDPKAQQDFNRQQRSNRTRTEGGFFWRPGELAPERAPNLANAFELGSK